MTYLAARERESRAKPWQFIATGGRIAFVRWLPDSSALELVSGTYQQRFARQDTRNGTPSSDAVASVDTSRLLNARFMRWNPDRHTFTQGAQAPAYPLLRAYSADGTRYALSENKLHIALYDAPTGRWQRAVRASAPAQEVALSSDGTLLAALSVARIEVWDARTGVLRATLHTQGEMQHLLFSPRGTFIGALSSSQVCLWQAATGQPLHRIAPPFGGELSAFDFAPDERSLALTDEQARIALYDLPTKVWQTQTDPASNTLYDVRFSPDGQCLATGGIGVVTLWKAQPLTPLRSIRVQGAPVEDTYFARVRFSPDSRHLAAETNFGKVVLCKLR